MTAFAALFAAVGAGLLLIIFFAMGAAIPKITNDIPSEQRMNATRNLGVKKPNLEEDFFLIKTVCFCESKIG